MWGYYDNPYIAQNEYEWIRDGIFTKIKKIIKCPKIDHLLIAIKFNNLKLVKLFIRRGCDFKDPRTVNYPVMYNRHDILRYLIYKGLDVSKCTILNCAIENNELETVKFLVSKGCKIVDNRFTKYIIYNLINNNYLEMAKFILINKIINVDKNDNLCVNAIIKKGDIPFLKFLLKQGYLLEPDSILESIQFPEMMRFLLEQKCNVNSHFLDICILYGVMEPILIFEEFGYWKTKNNVFLTLACKSRQLDIVRYFIETIGCDVTTQNNLCLKISEKNSDIEMAKLLISHGADPSVLNCHRFKTQLGICTDYIYDKIDEMNFCSICCNEDDNNFIKLKSCSHVFHKICFENYLNFSSQNITCPMCRQKF